MLPDFTNINYLQHGNALQQAAFYVLKQSKILYHLEPFKPVLCGTLPINIFIEGSSDLDIICEVQDFDNLNEVLEANFKTFPGFSITIKPVHSTPSLICGFHVDNFLIEVFAQPIPVNQQAAYKHMLIEHYLLNTHGEQFREKIVELKKQGYKTEPAFAKLLNLKGEPYSALLELANEYLKQQLAG
ncbi:DUF4269 domain-containing protein [Fulvivirgaceae bacterium PWU20]|uniref:DUF4269 domain-containing protein n=2 Tax=Chryseosolibacter indicus TaxID=2782351 RepID=A0ABS5VP37_9BACT|nr:DUF4269 domain-containing protein [Chryseosolibacter indicus]